METNHVVPHAVVTCGPATTPIDAVRRITNFSTGELGVQLTEALLEQGWNVTCFKGKGSTYRDPEGSRLTLKRFDTNGDLLDGLLDISDPDRVQVVFHAAALSDFEVAEISGPNHELLTSKKIPSAYEEVHLILRPAFKVLPRMEELFARAVVVGWKFELEGNTASALVCARAQLELSRSTLCILNGTAYGNGFGIVNRQGLLADVASRDDLAEWLTTWAGDFLRGKEPVPAKV